jgi:hypothetical protein
LADLVLLLLRIPLIRIFDLILTAIAAKIEPNVEVILQLQGEAVEVLAPDFCSEALLVSVDQIVEDLFEVLGRVLELNEGLTEIGETISYSYGIVRDHGA